MALAYDDYDDYDDHHGNCVLLIHGHPFDRTLWDPQAAAFHGSFRVLVPDLRGFGRSPVTPGRVTMRELAADIEELLDGLGIARTAIVGLSMGGLVAMELAAARPQHYWALALIATTAEPPSPATCPTWRPKPSSTTSCWRFSAPTPLDDRVPGSHARPGRRCAGRAQRGGGLAAGTRRQPVARALRPILGRDSPTAAMSRSPGLLASGWTPAPPSSSAATNFASALTQQHYPERAVAPPSRSPPLPRVA